MKRIKMFAEAAKLFVVGLIALVLAPVAAYAEKYLCLHVQTLGLYDPLFYAQEAIQILFKALGMANAVHRGYDSTPQQKGSTIKINVPSSFVAANAPANATDLEPTEVEIKLDQWKEVKMSLTDKELTYTKEQIIADHIAPAAYALADNIDLALNALYKDIPWTVTAAASTYAPADILAARRVLFNNKAPMNDGMNFAEIGGVAEEHLLGNAAFAQWQGSGPVGVDAQINGVLGRRYGIGVFANQNTPIHTSGIGGADVAGVAAVALKGAKTMTATAVTISRTGFGVAGDSFSIAGHTQKYVLTATATSDGSGNLPIAFEPGLEAATAGTEAVTFDLTTAAFVKDTGLVFHRRAFALAMAPLSTLGDGLGARIETVTDPVTRLSLRSRVYYVGDSSALKVALDVLYGVKTIDRNRACRLRAN